MARQIWGRQALQTAIAGACWGGTAALPLIAAATWLRIPVHGWAALVGVAAGAVAVGAVAGAILGFKRRWNLSQVALFLDHRLATGELLVTALETEPRPSAVGALLRAQAERALQTVPRGTLSLRLFTPRQAFAVPVFAASVWLATHPPQRAQAPIVPGSARVKLDTVRGLDRVEALEQAPSLSNADAQRLRQLAEQAKKLRRDLAKGVEEREAQAELARLREELDGQRQRFSDRAERAGLEAALSELGAEPSTRKAEKALGDGDIIAFDEEMQRLATRAEARARDAAREALERAKQRAREQKAQKLADMLERQSSNFAKREQESAALRELAKQLEGALSAEGKEALSELNGTGNPAAQRRLAEALAKALESLSDEERKRLAEALKQRLSGAAPGAQALSREELSRMLKELETPEGREALARALRELAREDNLDAERERALGEAERGRAQAERGLSKLPLPMPGPGMASPGSDPGSKANTGAPSSENGGPASGQPGSGPGRGDHGRTKPEAVRSEEFRARAEARWLPGESLAGRSFGRAPGRAGETANEVGMGSLLSRGNGEVGAVEGGDVPEEYREQVGRYFEP
ncbi:MAG TPA: hypothetical protein VFQ61_25045 [Polyangiaceae bacterium]|nr:hypothetical protein [Polyangiaceae bacterium]